MRFYKLYTLSFFVLLISCSKGWLDVKPNKSLVVPTTIDDYQALLDNSAGIFNKNAPALHELSSDNFYLMTQDWLSRQIIEMNSHIWAQDIFMGNSSTDWNSTYTRIFNTNVVLEGLRKNTPSADDELSWDNVKGSALFFRAFDFFNLSQMFSKSYSEATSATDRGIPIRLSENVNDRSERASVQQTYDQIINDLHMAKNLLPKTPLYKTRPSMPAVYSLLARVYLSMEKYDSAFYYSDLSISLFNSMLDFNTLSPTASRPVPRFNDEVIFHCTMINYSSFNVGITDSILFNSYQSDDLRKTIFFTATKTFKGSFDGSANPFCGLTTGENYLIRSECNARKGRVQSAMDDLNTLLMTRWKNTVTYQPVTANDLNDALNKILLERKKELINRGVRWSDLRRLNKDDRFKITLTRIENGKAYFLEPNSNRYVFPIPDDEIRLSGIEQNSR